MTVLIMTAVKKRNRGILLDSVKVRREAGKKGMRCFTSFELNALKKFPCELDGSKSMRKAWYGGEKMDPRLALMIAQSLDLPDFLPLVKSLPTIADAWERLLENSCYQKSFFDLIYTTKDQKKLVHFTSGMGKSNPKIPIEANWKLHLNGQPGEVVFLIIRCSQQFYQFAPVPFDGYENVFSKHKLVYPGCSDLAFDVNKGKGWRQIIAIKSRSMPSINKTSNTGFNCSIDELNYFAQALEGVFTNEISIDTYTFELI